ncbi:unnamed protein product [Pleuronectes platessa]|uniref:Uncharacterized protein n=1 Tax=Pleuronectes platessa TaxID=8262 RepID=A0A9N7VQ24_PLEPL|nr:unnamed protein product [Pleuronectes platessa]
MHRLKAKRGEGEEERDERNERRLTESGRGSKERGTSSDERRRGASGEEVEEEEEEEEEEGGAGHHLPSETIETEDVNVHRGQHKKERPFDITLELRSEHEELNTTHAHASSSLEKSPLVVSLCKSSASSSLVNVSVLWCYWLESSSSKKKNVKVFGTLIIQKEPGVNRSTGPGLTDDYSAPTMEGTILSKAVLHFDWTVQMVDQ